MDTSIYKKYNQLKKLGFKNICVYIGGMFEWLFTRNIWKSFFLLLVWNMIYLSSKHNILLFGLNLTYFMIRLLLYNIIMNFLSQVKLSKKEWDNTEKPITDEREQIVFKMINICSTQNILS